MKKSLNRNCRLALLALLVFWITLPTTHAEGNWSPTGSMNSGSDSLTATLLGNGKVLVLGGWNGSAFSTANLYDPATGTWTSTGSMSSARSGHTATLLGNGKVLAAGGFTGSVQLSGAELYDPTTGTWTSTGSMSSACSGHTATLLGNGKVLVAGGSNLINGYLFRSELYDPATGTWTSTGSMSKACAGHTATLLGNGKVLVAGGDSDFGFRSHAELYDPATAIWTITGSMINVINGRNHTATLLPNGKVLVVGRAQSFPFPSPELYDPTTGIWSGTDTMNSARTYHTATLLPNGKVLVAGGRGNNWSELSSAELYNPITESWTNTGAMNSIRYSHTAILLANGKVLVAGGEGGSGYLYSAELYDPGSFTLSLSAPAQGSITGNTSPYVSGSSATLNATPNPGYVFASWMGDASGITNPLSVLMDLNKTIGATFEPDLSDTDDDGLSAYDEIVTYGTNPNLKDTDSDGFNDGFEVNTGFNPILATSTPDALSSIRTAVEFRFNAASGVSYRIEGSTDLQVWNTVETDIIGQSAVVTRFYSIENQPKRYFRVRRN